MIGMYLELAMMMLNTLSLSVSNGAESWVQCLSELLEEAQRADSPVFPLLLHSWSSSCGGKGR